MKGLKFGSLLVVDENFSSKNGHRVYNCKCECGNYTKVTKANLFKGKVKSCGCYRRKLNRERNLTHGMTNHPIYRTWDGMMQRCHNPNNASYVHYGMRNIIVCDEWRDPRVFIEWASENGWKKGLQIDRIDNDGNYTPSNCRIVSAQQNSAHGRKRTQSNNKSGYVGVSKLKNSNGFEVCSKLDKKKIHIGRFYSINEAVEARIKWEIEFLGEQKTNFHYNNMTVSI